MMNLLLSTLSFFLCNSVLLAFQLQRKHVYLLSSSRLSLDRVDFGGIHHCGLLVQDLNKALTFYTEVLGLQDVTVPLRPNLPYPGAFLSCGEQQIHLMRLPNPDEASVRPDYAGRDRHIAIAVKDLKPLESRLSKYNIPYKLSSSGRRAMFCRDPDGNGLEFIETF